jgi:hypothetical protein
MTAGICLTLGAVHFLIWTHERDRWANLVFSIDAGAAAGYSILDMVELRAQTPAEHMELLRGTILLAMRTAPRSNQPWARIKELLEFRAIWRALEKKPVIP